MNTATAPLAGGAHGLLVACILLFGIIAVFKAPWREFLAYSSRQHVFMVSVLALILLWLGSIEVRERVDIHLLGLTPVVLIFGWELALILGYFVCLLLVLLGFWAWPLLPTEILLSVLAPVAVTQGVLSLADQLRRTNLFVYLLGVGFLGGVLSMLVSLLLGSRLLGWELDHALALLLAFPEGFISGAVVTALTVFYPSIMRTYDDVRYLGD